MGTLGYFKDELTRLYVRARYLRVDLGQWMTVDPLWPVESAFGYARSEPVGVSDQGGLQSGDPYLDCWYNLVLRGITPFGACVRCKGHRVGGKSCDGLPTRPLDAIFLDLLRHIFGLCPGEGSGDVCCTSIATDMRLGKLLHDAGVFTRPMVPSNSCLGCFDRCRKAIAKGGDPPSKADILAGARACFGENPNKIGPLDVLIQILEHVK